MLTVGDKLRDGAHRLTVKALLKTVGDGERYLLLTDQYGDVHLLPESVAERLNKREEP
jgi:hypothetical protein